MSWSSGGPVTDEVLGSSLVSAGELVPSREMDYTHSLGLEGSGTLLLTYFTAKRSETISQMRMQSGNAAAGATPTLVRWGVYEVDPTTGQGPLVASIANDTSIFASTFTTYTRALSSSWSKVKGRRYAVGVLIVTAAAMPTVLGVAEPAISFFNTVLGYAPRLAAGVTGQTDLPADLGSVTLVDRRKRCYTELLV